MNYSLHTIRLNSYLFSLLTIDQPNPLTHYITSYQAQHQWIRSGDIIEFFYEDKKIRVTVESVKKYKKIIKAILPLNFEKVLFDIDPPIKDKIIVIKYNMKPNLVLDLDETLIHTFPVNLNNDNLHPLTTEIQNFTIITGIFESYRVYVRPKLSEFIEELSSLYNIYVYSNGGHHYVNQVCENLEHSHKILKIFARTDLTLLEPKNLEKYGLDPTKTVIVDDRVEVWDPKYHKNVIRIPRFALVNNFFTNCFDLGVIKNMLHLIYEYYRLDTTKDIREHIY